MSTRPFPDLSSANLTSTTCSTIPALLLLYQYLNAKPSISLNVVVI
jgi:hypothetical protein